MNRFFKCHISTFVPIVLVHVPVKRLLLVFCPLLLLAVQAPQAHSQTTPQPERFSHDALHIGPRHGPRSPGLVIQKAHCVAATSCTLARPVEPGDMLVVIVGLPSTTSTVVTDRQGDTFYQISATGWGGFGDPGPMWYATGVFGGEVTIQSTAKALDIFLAEYPPASLDQVSPQAFLCCQPSATVGPLTLKSPNNLLITWVIFGTNATIAPSSGFAMEDDGTSIAVEDVRVAAGTYSAMIPQAPTPWGARMVSFTLLGPEFSKYKAPYSPIQVKTCIRGGDGFVLPCQFDASVAQGNMLVVVGSLGCSPTNGSGCNSVSDSESNNWNIGFGVPNDNGILLWYALDVKGGTDTVYFAPGTGNTAIIAEYPASLGLEDANYGDYNDPIFHQPNGDQTTLDVTRAIQTKSPCDLLIAWSVSGTTNSDAGPGVNFTLRTYDEVANLALEDATSGVPGAYIGSMTWSSFAHWDMGVAAFNMAGCK
jgi:hypothetical protein